MKTSINHYVLEILEQLADAADAEREALALTRSCMADLLLLDGREQDRFFELIESRDLTVLQALDEMDVAIEDPLVEKSEVSGVRESDHFAPTPDT